MRFCTLLMLSLALPHISSSQSRVDRKEIGLTLRIHAEELSAGVPESFSFTLLNEAATDIYVPNPSIACAGRGYEGSVSVILLFKPFNPQDGGLGGGCSEEDTPTSTIEERAKSWVLLHPGKSLTVKASMNQLNYLDSIAGVYRFKGLYQPPFISEKDASTLESLGIKYPQRRLETEPITFTTKHN